MHWNRAVLSCNKQWSQPCLYILKILEFGKYCVPLTLRQIIYFSALWFVLPVRRWDNLSQWGSGQDRFSLFSNKKVTHPRANGRRRGKGRPCFVPLRISILFFFSVHYYFSLLFMVVFVFFSDFHSGPASESSFARRTVLPSKERIRSGFCWFCLFIHLFILAAGHSSRGFRNKRVRSSVRSTIPAVVSVSECYNVSKCFFFI